MYIKKPYEGPLPFSHLSTVYPTGHGAVQENAVNVLEVVSCQCRGDGETLESVVSETVCVLVPRGWVLQLV